MEISTSLYDISIFSDKSQKIKNKNNNSERKKKIKKFN